MATTGPYNSSVLPELLDRALANRRWTQAQLAERLGITQQTVSKWKNGETRPRPEIIPLLAELLGLETRVVFEEGSAYRWPITNDGPLVTVQKVNDEEFEIRIDRPDGRPLPPTDEEMAEVRDSLARLAAGLEEDGPKRPAALSGAAMPDDLTEDERRLVEGFIEGLRARRDTR